LTKDEADNMIAWRQGLFYKIAVPPYQEVITTADAVEGVPYHEGYRSAYDSFIAQGKKFPDDVNFDMGAVDIRINKVANKPKLGFNRDSKYDKQRNKPKVTKGTKSRNVVTDERIVNWLSQ
jgi:hypothetical protein